jgi:adenosylcobinamide kinase/adenosylcobinamide-phosphate guanylyltransferase
MIVKSLDKAGAIQYTTTPIIRVFDALLQRKNRLSSWVMTRSPDGRISQRINPCRPSEGKGTIAGRRFSPNLQKVGFFVEGAMASGVIMVIGGARSGKSSFAQTLASAREGRKVFIATAQAGDEEMKLRIEKHRRERPAGWHTIEEPCRLPQALDGCAGAYEVVLIDCIGLWISNLLLADAAEGEILQQVDALLARCRTSGACVIIVSNETGMGIVPDNRLSRRFRDVLGKTNQELARAADEVFFLLAGIPLQVKGASSAPSV